MTPLQSGFRTLHCTESLIMRLLTDIFWSFWALTGYSSCTLWCKDCFSILWITLSFWIVWKDLLQLPISPLFGFSHSSRTVPTLLSFDHTFHLVSYSFWPSSGLWPGPSPRHPVHCRPGTDSSFNGCCCPSVCTLCRWHPGLCSRPSGCCSFFGREDPSAVNLRKPSNRLRFHCNKNPTHLTWWSRSVC